MKPLLNSALLLAHYDPTLLIVVDADNSVHGGGAIISHTFPDRSEKKFHRLLYRHRVTLLTDHKQLLSIFSSKKGIPVYSVSRLKRWASILIGSDFDIRYCYITDFGQADALFRLICNYQEPEGDTVIAAISIDDDVRRQFLDISRGIPVTAADIRRVIEQDPVLRQAISYVQATWPTSDLTGDLYQLFLGRASLSVVDSCLMFADRIAIPHSLRPAVQLQFHAAHPATSRMKSIAHSRTQVLGAEVNLVTVASRKRQLKLRLKDAAKFCSTVRTEDCAIQCGYDSKPTGMSSIADAAEEEKPKKRAQYLNAAT
ncbi:unnamed protein product [Dibothriocephalus latus]|uniref:Reverse transcriptase RNase H-like domain-containing protein n=1 Tax=Dibothriocephalus latus TaxID=60516 RepID=A0A3P7LP11_DIBLA|nr:unnamed protein product [Dibothriocephalus latus]